EVKVEEEIIEAEKKLSLSICLFVTMVAHSKVCRLVTIPFARKNKGLKRGLQSVNSSDYPMIAVLSVLDHVSSGKQQNGSYALNIDIWAAYYLFLDQFDPFPFEPTFSPQAILQGDSGVIEEEAQKEWEHTLLQDSIGKELHELNKLGVETQLIAFNPKSTTVPPVQNIQEYQQKSCDMIANPCQELFLPLKTNCKIKGHAYADV
ncbi:hypothetical protein Tco_1089379, partial [Tanacetum coccineum]